MNLHKIFTISGVIYIGVGLLLEILYFTIWKDIYWILLIYPPPHIQNLIMMAPYIGGLFILIGGGSILTGLWLYLKADLLYLRKHKAVQISAKLKIGVSTKLRP